jgi:hypothetical protein
MLLDLRDIDICVTQIDIGNAATSMTAGIGHRACKLTENLAAGRHSMSRTSPGR